MSNITISELRPIETEFEELSNLELEAVAVVKGGGRAPRSVVRTDNDGDGRWDSKVVFRGDKVVRVVIR